MEDKNIISPVPSIDSLRIRIPVKDISILDNSLYDEIIHSTTIVQTGETEDTARYNHWKEYYYSNTSKVKMKIMNVTTSKGETEECLVILLNSKLLGCRYFEGITINNIELLFERIMSLNVFKTSMSLFLEGNCTDIDFKLDEFQPTELFDHTILTFASKTIPRKSTKGYILFSPTKLKPYNRGIKYSDRRTASPSYPFVHSYWKGGELLSSSLAFYREHLTHIAEGTIEKIVRLETNVKNREHAKLLGIKNTSLLEILCLSHNQLEHIFRTNLGKHINNFAPSKKSKQVKGVAPDSLMLIQAIKFKYSEGKTIEEIQEFLTATIFDKSTRSRKKKMIRELFHNFVDIERYNDNDMNIDGFLKLLQVA